jgi:hypothetical protein
VFLSTVADSMIPAFNVLWAMQLARQSPVFRPFVDGLGDAYVAWNDTTLDPAYYPFAFPKANTLDDSLMEAWYSSSHIYSAVFVEYLPQFIPESYEEASENSYREDVAAAQSYACFESPNSARDLVSSDSLEDERSSSRRMFSENSKGEQGYANAYRHAMSCIEALKRDVMAVPSWSTLRRFTACAWSLGDEESSSIVEDPLLQPNMHDALHPIEHDILSGAASKKTNLCAPGVKDCSSWGSLVEVEETPSDVQTEQHMHAEAEVSKRGQGQHERVCGRKPLVEVTLMVNETAKHAVPYALNAANNAALRALAGKGFVTNATISVTLEAFPVVATEQWVRLFLTYYDSLRLADSL